MSGWSDTVRASDDEIVSVEEIGSVDEIKDGQAQKHT